MSFHHTVAEYKADPEWAYLSRRTCRSCGHMVQFWREPHLRSESEGHAFTSPKTDDDRERLTLHWVNCPKLGGTGGLI